MMNVAPELKEAFNPDDGQGGRYIDYSVTWGVINNEAQASATPTALQEASISRIDQITNGNDEPLNIATFEPGGWPLDGSVVIPPRVDEVLEAEIGLIMPELSGADGVYMSPQVITLVLPYKYSWIAFTVSFGHVPAADFALTYYEDSSILRAVVVTDNAGSTYVDMPGIEGCNKVVLSITRSSLPYHRARVCEITFGVTRKYNKSNSEGLQITETIDPLNERVPANELRISVENFATEYNIFDPSVLYKYLQQRQRLKPRIGAQQADGNMGYVRMGNYYLLAPELKNNFSRLDLRATSLLGVLQDTIYSKGVYKTATIEEFLQDVASDANVLVSYPEWFEDLVLTSYIPSASHAEAFRLIAQATNTLLLCNREDVICFVEPASIPSQTLTKADYRSGDGLQPSDDKITNTVEVETVEISVLDMAEKLAEITGAGKHSLKYDPSLSHSISITGGSLVSANFYVDNAIVEISGGTAVITGKRLSKTVRIISATVAQPNEAQLVYPIKGNSLIQAANGPAVASHYLQTRAVKRRQVRMRYRGYPYIEMADCINYNTGDYITQPFLVTKNALSLAGGMAGTLETRERP